MSDPDTFTPDELASAYVDGELDADDAARVEADPELMRRVDEFRRIAEQVQAPVTVADDAREAAVDAALGAATPIAGVEDRHAPIISLRDHRPAPRRPRLRLRIAVGIGAVAAIALGVVGLAGQLGDSGSDDNDVALDAVADEAAPTTAPVAEAAPATARTDGDEALAAAGATDDADDEAQEAAGPTSQPPTTAGADSASAAVGPAGLPDLGSFADLDGLVRALAAAPPGAVGGAAATVGDCVVDEGLAPSATAVIDDGAVEPLRVVVLVVIDADPPTYRLLDTTTCRDDVEIGLGP